MKLFFERIKKERRFLAKKFLKIFHNNKDGKGIFGHEKFHKNKNFIILINVKKDSDFRTGKKTPPPVIKTDEGNMTLEEVNYSELTSSSR